MRRSMVAAALVALAQAASADMPASLYSVGSGEVTGRYFAAAREICARANRTMAPASRCSPEPTRGSIYNLAGLRTGALSYAIVQSDWLHHAHAGSDRFAAAGPMESLRVVAPLYVEAVTIVARPGAGVAGVADLVGKRVDVGHPSSGRRATAEVVLAAAGFGIGEQAFRKKFRRLTGLTPSQYRSRRLIERACLLLEQTDQTGRSIALQLGFESEFYFSRRFKQLMGVSPRVYRQRAGHGGPHSVVEDDPRAWSDRGGQARRKRNV